MNGYMLAFYVHENHKHNGVLTWQWLLQEAQKLGVGGGTAYQASAGYGRHRVLHIDQFFGAGVICIKIEFLVSATEKARLVELLAREKMDLFFSESDARFGMIGAGDAP
jgi:hypothetical protein